jgi:hypothetical protein
MSFLCAVRPVTQVWDSATNFTKNARLDWDTVQSYSTATFATVSAMTGKAQDTAQDGVQKKME